MRRAVVGTLLVAALLAGCTGDAPKHSASSFTLQEVRNEVDTGSISGVVVDPAIRPLAHIQVRLGGGPNDTTETSAQGLFVFRDLAPGLYTLRVAAFQDPANATAYLDTQTTAEVQAGETAKVRMVLAGKALRVGFHQTMKFDGFFQASEGYADEALDLAVWNHTYGPVSTPPSPACTCRFSFTTDGNVTTLVAELVWDEQAAVPNYWNMDLRMSNASTFVYCKEGSPCVQRFQQGSNFTAQDSAFSIGVWTDPLWLYVNQKFTLFATAFYVTDAPQGWSFVAGGP